MKHPLFANAPAVIGMVHFSALEGSDEFEGRAVVRERAQADLASLCHGGVDAVMFENNFDLPKYERLPQAQREHFIELVRELVPACPLPWGISALWNDYELGLELCTELGGMMVRVPVFTDDVETAYGPFHAHPDEVISVRNRIAPNVLMLADVQVKHATMITPRPFSESLLESVERGSDGVVITGQWTGDPPSPEQCAEAKRLAGGKCYILTGSGMTADNIASFAPSIDACIVGTAFKEGGVDTSDRSGPNLVEARRRFDVGRIKAFVDAVRLTKTLHT